MIQDVSSWLLNEIARTSMRFIYSGRVVILETLKSSENKQLVCESKMRNKVQHALAPTSCSMRLLSLIWDDRKPVPATVYRTPLGRRIPCTEFIERADVFNRSVGTQVRRSNVCNDKSSNNHHREMTL